MLGELPGVRRDGIPSAPVRLHGRKRRIEELLSSKGIYTCLSCFACVERCPRNVEPPKLIEAVRNAVERQQGMDHLKPERIPEILDGELPQQAIAAAFRKYKK